MKIRKKLSLILLLCTSLNVVFLPSQVVFAESNTAYLQSRESDYEHLKSERSIWIKVTKAAIRTAIKNRQAVVSVVREVSGRTVANQVDKYFGVVARSITPLLKWTDIPANAVYDAVFSRLTICWGQ
ncbi:TPA: hypothetical protein ACGOYW_001209 [Streptococcus suis]